MPFATREDVTIWAKELSQGFLECRELGHNWKPRTAVLAEGGFYDRVLRCPRCRTERVEVLSQWGEVLQKHYVYPEGYQQKLGRIVRDGRDALRLESMYRSLKE